jgi:beta-hydroxylase
MTDSTSAVFKILTQAQWVSRGDTVPWAPVDEADGFLHLSTAEQLDQTLALHFAGQSDLVVLALDPTSIPDLRWEASRGGALFPHAYGPTPIDAVVGVEERKGPI